MDMQKLDKVALAASDLLKALASPNRLKILCNLLDGEKSVGEIAAFIGIREPAVSQHLTVLRKDRLVRSRRSGQSIYYMIDSALAESILFLLYQEFCPSGIVKGVSGGEAAPREPVVPTV